MAEWGDVERLASALPEVGDGTTYGNDAWKVRGKTFAWSRPLGKNDRKQLGDRAPDEARPILAVKVPAVELVGELLKQNEAFFTIPHFDGYPAVLMLLDEVSVEDLDEALTEAWLCTAPPKLAAQWRSENAVPEA